MKKQVFDELYSGYVHGKNSTCFILLCFRRLNRTETEVIISTKAGQLGGVEQI